MIFSTRSQNPITQLALLASLWIWVIVRTFMTEIPSIGGQFFEPLSNILFSNLPPNSLGNRLIFIFLIAFQSIYLSVILQKHDIIERNYWLPSILYFLIISIPAGNLALTPALIANLFLILLMERLFESYDSIKGIDNVMLSGFYASLSTLFYFPSVLFILGILLGLFVLRHIEWRYFVVTIIGIFLPLLYIGTWFFVTDQIVIEISIYRSILNNIFAQISNPQLDKPFLLVFLIIFFILSLFYTFNHQQEKLIKIRKKNGIIFVLSIISVFSIFSSYSPIAQSFSFAALMLSVTSSIYLIEMKKRLLSSILFWIILVFSIISNLGFI